MAFAVAKAGRQVFARASYEQPLLPPGPCLPAGGFGCHPIRSVPWTMSASARLLASAEHYSSRRAALQGGGRESQLVTRGGVALTTFAGGMAPHCWQHPCFSCASPACFLFLFPSLCLKEHTGSELPQRARNGTGVVRCLLRQRPRPCWTADWVPTTTPPSLPQRGSRTPEATGWHLARAVQSRPSYCYQNARDGDLMRSKRPAWEASLGAWKPGATGSRFASSAWQLHSMRAYRAYFFFWAPSEPA